MRPPSNRSLLIFLRVQTSAGGFLNSAPMSRSGRRSIADEAASCWASASIHLVTVECPVGSSRFRAERSSCGCPDAPRGPVGHSPRTRTRHSLDIRLFLSPIFDRDGRGGGAASWDGLIQVVGEGSGIWVDSLWQRLGLFSSLQLKIAHARARDHAREEGIDESGDSR